MKYPPQLFLLIVFLLMSLFTINLTGQHAIDHDKYYKSESRWKNKTELTAFQVASISHYWNLRKKTDPSLHIGLGFSFASYIETFTIGPQFDFQKLSGTGRVRPLYGLQIGGGLLFDTYSLETEASFFQIIPYAGLSIPVGHRMRLEPALQLRYFNVEWDDIFWLPSFSLGIKF